MAATTTRLAAYLRLPPDAADDLTVYLSAAQSKARSAGVPELQNNAQYDLFILSLAAMYYDQRGMSFGGSNPAGQANNAERMINAFVLELRHAVEDHEGCCK